MMSVIWMLWIAAICKTSQGNGMSPTSSEEVTNLTTAPSLKSLSTSTESPKPTRDKRGTGHFLDQLLNENELKEINEDANNYKEKRSPGGLDNPRVRFSSWAGKRAKFSSWGGKRADEELINNLGGFDYEIPEQKRAKFSSWAGKRADDENGINWEANRVADPGDYDQMEEKRAKFSSWAGKRDEDKRKFSSWAGKRFDDPNIDNNDIKEDKRAKFSPWAGKRAKFNSWGGKRFNLDDDGSEYEENIVEEKRKPVLPFEYGSGKRAKFSSWGGKRADDELWGFKRARFNSWGGKRSIINNETNTNVSEIKSSDHEDGVFKRSPVAYAPLSWKRKPVFSSWGGKRTARSAQPQRRFIIPSNLFREHSSWGALMRPIRRGPDFYAWGGKRST